MGLDLDIGYYVLSVNLVFVGSFIVGNVEIKELQRFLIIFGIHRVFDVDGVLLIQYSLKRSSGVHIFKPCMAVFYIPNKGFWCNWWIFSQCSINGIFLMVL